MEFARCLGTVATIVACVTASGVGARNSPEVDFSYVEISGLPVTLLVTPAGTGPTLADLGVTITVHALTATGPVADFPREEVSLVSLGGGTFTPCAPGITADAGTDASGTTTITGAMVGGGWTEGDVVVALSGVPLAGQPLDLRLVSPDFDGNRVVDLADVAQFTVDYTGAYAWRSDLEPDGTLDLADIGVFAAHLGESCP